MLTFPLLISLHRSTCAFSFERIWWNTCPCLNAKEWKQDSQMQKKDLEPIWHRRSSPRKYTLQKNCWGNGVPGMLHQIESKKDTGAIAFQSMIFLESTQNDYPFPWEVKGYSNSRSRRLAIAWPIEAFVAEIYIAWSERNTLHKKTLREPLCPQVKKRKIVLFDFRGSHTTTNYNQIRNNSRWRAHTNQFYRLHTIIDQVDIEQDQRIWWLKRHGKNASHEHRVIQ